MSVSWSFHLSQMIVSSKKQGFRILNCTLPGEEEMIDSPDVSAYDPIKYLTIDLQNYTYELSTDEPIDEKVVKDIEDAFLHARQISTFGDWSEKLSQPDSFEKDEQGNIYGYKVLADIYGELVSPMWVGVLNNSMQNHLAIWKNDRLTAHDIPHYESPAGIHGTKTLGALDQWIMNYSQIGNYALVIVKIMIWGVIVETEHGFRAEHAKIVEKRERIREYRKGNSYFRTTGA